MTEDTTTFATAGFDLSVIVRAVAAPLLLWTIVIVVTAWRGYPGVVCLTPMAWLLGSVDHRLVG